MKGFPSVPSLCVLALACACQAASPTFDPSQPADATINVASAANFSIVATNAVSYQWQTNSVDVPDATNAAFALDDVRANLNVDVVLSSDSQSITSRTALVKVLAGTIVNLTISGYPGGQSNVLTIQLFDHDKPATVQNFIHYIASGAYTNMFFSRLIPNFVLQGGDYGASSPTNDDTPVEFGTDQIFSVDTSFVQNFRETPNLPLWVDSEFRVGPLIHNRFGTIAMALDSGNPDSAEDGFFFNLADNSTNLDLQNGGFTVFGRVTSGTNALAGFNSLAKPDQGIFDESTIDDNPFLTDLPVNFSGFDIPVNTNLFYGVFNFQSGYPVDTNFPSAPETNMVIDPNTSDVQFFGSASDNVGVARVWGIVNNNALSITEGPLNSLSTSNWNVDCGALPAGSNYVLTISAQDGAGNLTNATYPFAVPAFPLRVNASGGGSVNASFWIYSNGLANNFVNESSGLINLANKAPIHSPKLSISVSPTPILIYSNSLVSNSVSDVFQAQGSAAYNLGNVVPAHSRPFSISVAGTSGQSLSFYHAPFDSASVSELTFWIDGGKGGEVLQVAGLVNVNGALTPAATTTLAKLPANAWRLITLPLSSLGVANVTNLSGFQLQITAAGTTNTFYLDDIQFVTRQPLVLYHSDFDSSLYGNLTFWVDGGAGRQVIQVVGLTDVNGLTTPAGTNTLPALAPNRWQMVTIPLASIGVANNLKFNGVQLLLADSGALATFYVDDMQLTASSSAAQGGAGILPNNGTVGLNAVTPRGEIFAGWSVGTNQGILSPNITYTNLNGGNVTAVFLANNLPGGIHITSPSAGAGINSGAVALRGSLGAVAFPSKVTAQIFAPATKRSVTASVSATTTSNTWSVSFPELPPGAYTAQAYMTDANGRSAVVYQNFNILAAVSIAVNGPGKTTLKTGTNFLQIGKVYSVRAVPGAGAIFHDWSGVGLERFTPVTIFELSADDTIEAPLLLTVTFVSNDLPKGAFAITSPKPNARVFGADLTVTGTQEGLTHITCQAFTNDVNAEPSTQVITASINGSNWSAVLPNLPGGSQKIVAVGYDSQGRARLLEQIISVSLFRAAAGSYSGLFYSTIEEPTTTTAGFFKLTLTSNGVASGQIQFPGVVNSLGQEFVFPIHVSIPLTGKVGLNPGGFSGQPLIVFLELFNQPDVISGVVDHGALSATLFGYRNPGALTATNSPAPGSYVMLFAPLNTDISNPTSPGYGFLTINPDGTFRLMGTLSDNSTFSQAGSVGMDGYLPICFTPSGYGAKGMVLGWQSFQTNTVTPNTIYWVKGAAGGAYYPNGFITQFVETSGGSYQPPTNGNYSIIFNGGTLTNALTNTLTFANGQFQTSPNVTAINLATNGGLSGLFVDPSGATASFNGAFVNPAMGGAGFVLDTNLHITAPFKLSATP